MKRVLLVAATFAAALAAFAAVAAALAQTPPAALAQTPPARGMSRAHGLGDTRCASCHTTKSWKDVRFDHARTGFLLRGAHERAACAGCHVQADFSQPVPISCAACHQDAHRGEFGQRCAGCHDEKSWKTNFTADAHRSTGFPLTGRHAFISCEECHVDKRDRSFSRAGAARCISCHARDFQAAAARSLDHVAFGFGQNCRDCHTPSSFAPARFAAHEQCFQIAGGPHAGIDCLGCHTRLTGLAPVPGSCATFTASCVRCHSCDRTDRIHQQQHQVPGYQCKDRKCYECHLFVAASGTRAPPRGAQPWRK